MMLFYLRTPTQYPAPFYLLLPFAILSHPKSKNKKTFQAPLNHYFNIVFIFILLIFTLIFQCIQNFVTAKNTHKQIDGTYLDYQNTVNKPNYRRKRPA